jgi:hypothetical protein
MEALPASVPNIRDPKRNVTSPLSSRADALITHRVARGGRAKLVMR